MSFTNEDLLSLSQLLDTKLQPIQEDIHSLKFQVGNEILPRLHNIEFKKLVVLDGRMDRFEGKIEALTENVETLTEDVETLTENVETLTENVETLTENVETLTENVETLTFKTKNMELLLENDVLPRIQNIETCYTSTYHRYAEGIDQLDGLQMDMDVVKKVMQKHSEQLQAIS